MAIRFHCGQCNQPIEVDDPWAGRAVACPYCRATVTAPATSTLGDLADVPVASAVGRGESGEAAVHPPTESTNPCALIALILAAVVVGLLGVGTMIAAPHALEMQQIAKDLEQAEKESGSTTQAILQYAQSHGGTLPTWMFLLGMIQMVAMALCVASIVCAIVGLGHLRRRGMAVAALAICGGITIYLCAGVAFSMW
jgi:hypothetical protein